jgi:type VI secretion system protein ImpL
VSKSKAIIITVAVVTFGVIVAFLRQNLKSVPGLHDANPMVISTLMILIGILASAVAAWLTSKKFSSDKDGGSPADAGKLESQDFDDLIEQAQDRLAEAEAEKDTKLNGLPAVFLIGDTASAKTSTMMNSGLEPELLAGQVYEESTITPTPTANFWFARHTLFIEAAGKLLPDTRRWAQLIGHMQPGKLASLMGTAVEMPRAALVCFDTESLLLGDTEATNTVARNLRERLTEVSQLLGINLPVYAVFTKADRVPFFADYFKNLNDQEARKILGMTLPVVSERKGVYSEEESARLGNAFDTLFRSLCNARPEFLSREGDPTKLAAVYEFPREFRKLRVSLIRSLVELCRPTQLNVGPFIRGFYFSGVRAVLVNELAPATSPAEVEQRSGSIGATSMFRAKSGTQQPAGAKRIVGTRKVPQWLFLGHLFNDILLADKTASGASTTSVKANGPRRILLTAAAALCLLYSGILVASFLQNRSLETKVRQSAAGLAALKTESSAAPSLDSLQRLENLRQSLELLTGYSRTGAPWSYRWGLYAGNKLLPDTRKLYFQSFQRLLLAPTQSVMLDFVRGLPPTGGPEYGLTYDTLKSYLITTSNHDKSVRSFLSPALESRWSANRNIDPERMGLAQKQFDFYSDELKIENPFSSDNDANAIAKARRYLGQFAGFERVYQAMLSDSTKNTGILNFNKKFPGSSDVVVDNYDVPGPFTKPGWDVMKASLKKPEKYFSGEQWVLGDQAAADVDRSKLGQQLADRYYGDFVKHWRAYFKAAAVVKYASVGDAAKKLSTLSGNQSPLLELFWLASQNTSVDKPEVSNIFQPAQAIVPPTNVDRYIAPTNQAYMNALVTLQASLEAVAAQPQNNDAQAAQTLTNATSAKVAARQVAQNFRIDPEGHLETLVQTLMEEPITNAEALLRSLGPAELNGKGKALCAPYRITMGKYPFNPAGTQQATVAEVNALFRKPDGALWKLYDESLQKLLPKQGSQYVPVAGGTTTLTPAFVAFFNQAATFSEFVYTGNAQDPHMAYSLKPVPTDGIQTVGLQLDGQTFTYSGGDTVAKQFTWQATGQHEAKATVRFGGGPDLAWSSNEGLWAIFQFFNKAEQWYPTGNGNTLEWVIRIGKDPVTLPNGKPVTVRLELDMGSAPPVFQKGYFPKLACVAEVAK